MGIGRIGLRCAAILDPAEHSLDTISSLVAAFVILDGFLARLAPRNAGVVPFSIRVSRNQSASYPLSARSHLASGKFFIKAAAPV